jgi:ubiquitin-activating enzyme E1 C
VNNDDPDDMNWLYQRALERATAYNIQGVDYSKTLGVVKNIIPAIASTNALISAAASGEVLKLLTGFNTTVKNYYMYMGQSGVYSLTYETEAKEGCVVC